MSRIISTGLRYVRRFLLVNRRCLEKHSQEPGNKEALEKFKLSTRVAKHVVIDQGKRTLTGAREIMESFMGIQKLRAARKKLADLQRKIRVVEATRSQNELELLQLRKKIAEVNASQNSADRNGSLYYDLMKKEFLLNSERIRLMAMLDVKRFELLMLQHHLTQVRVEIQTIRQQQLAQSTRVAKLLLTIMWYFFL